MLVLGNSFTTVLLLGGSRNDGHLAVSTKLNVFNLCQILVSFISVLLVIDWLSMLGENQLHDLVLCYK